MEKYVDLMSGECKQYIRFHGNKSLLFLACQCQQTGFLFHFHFHLPGFYQLFVYELTQHEKAIGNIVLFSMCNITIRNDRFALRKVMECLLRFHFLFGFFFDEYYGRFYMKRNLKDKRKWEKCWDRLELEILDDFCSDFIFGFLFSGLIIAAEHELMKIHTIKTALSQ